MRRFNWSALVFLAVLQRAVKTAAFLFIGLSIIPGSVLHAQPTAYVANFGDDTVTPITIATNMAGTPIDVGKEPSGVAITSDTLSGDAPPSENIL